MAKSLNKVQLIGNLTRDPELRYTPSGSAVCTFGIATNRSWTTDSGEKREEVDFHNIVAWRKLAELCSQFLVKGRKVYVEGRLSTRNWTGKDGQQRTTTEIIIDDMILIDSRGAPGVSDQSGSGGGQKTQKSVSVKAPTKEQKEEVPQVEKESEEEVLPDDIPF